ncbi:MAG: class II glutamine amidotransferase [Clostridia bacterium]|nr:class II glutamine amidotransferase [Clostridia bacterium]
MCELLGVNSARDVRMNDYLAEFYTHCDKNHHGWGLALFRESGVSIEKEPVCASRSRYLRERLNADIEGKKMFAHIRLATMGAMVYDNAHPFVRTDQSGRTWTLVHNGTLFHFPAADHFFYEQRGETDSERILLYLVDQMNEEIDRAGRPLTAEERFQVLDKIVCLMAEGNKLNLMIDDGELMYFHTNYEGTLHVSEHDGTAVFSTYPLKNGTDWKPVPFTQLFAYRDGKMCYKGTVHGNEYKDNAEDTKFLFVNYAEL